MLGMHRSGTSAVTRVVNLLGADLGSQLLDPQEDNKQGFWEHVQAVEIHEELLAELDRNWHDIREMPVDWLEHPASQRALDRIVELIRSDLSASPLWAVKDPRMCRLAPLWLMALQRLGIRATVLIVVRDPREVARSLNERDGWSYAHSYYMWAQHVLEASRTAEGVSRSVISYDDLMSDWARAMARVGAELKIEWPKAIEVARPEVENFINPGDRHHRAGEYRHDLPGAALPPPILMELYGAFQEIAASRADWSSVIPLDQRYRESVSIYAQLIDELTCKLSKLEDVAIERMEHINGLVAHRDQLVLEKNYYEGISLERLEHIRRLDEEAVERQGKLETELATIRSAVPILQSERDGLTEKVQHLEELTRGLEVHLERLRALTRDRKWLLRRIWRQTVRQPDGPDDYV